MIENDYLRNEIVKMKDKLNLPVYVVSLDNDIIFVVGCLSKAKDFIITNIIDSNDIESICDLGDIIEDSETINVHGRRITISRRNIL